MELTGRRVLVTGGAGFVGSHLVDSLVEENEVVVVDDLRSGERERVASEADLRVGDLLDPGFLDSLPWNEFDAVFHLAADPDVRSSVDEPEADLRVNAVATRRVLEACCEGGVGVFAFTSSSTVYGEAPTPTPETYGPMAPESPYGASKLASEGFCTAYAATEGIDVRVFRLANVVGEGCHGVIPDFVRKLQQDPSVLEILGDGRQEKSYVHVDDCVDGMLAAVEDGDRVFYNIGNLDTVSVTRIAEIVSEEIGLDPEFTYTGGRRGWKGDVPRMRLDVSRLRELGWSPGLDGEETVRQTVRGSTL